MPLIKNEADWDQLLALDRSEVDTVDADKYFYRLAIQKDLITADNWVHADLTEVGPSKITSVNPFGGFLDQSWVKFDNDSTSALRGDSFRETDRFCVSTGHGPNNLILHSGVDETEWFASDCSWDQAVVCQFVV